MLRSELRRLIVLIIPVDEDKVISYHTKEGIGGGGIP